MKDEFSNISMSKAMVGSQNFTSDVEPSPKSGGAHDVRDTHDYQSKRHHKLAADHDVILLEQPIEGGSSSPMRI
jgi:hypothetical protein